jgi:hypothetical protein
MLEFQCRMPRSNRMTLRAVYHVSHCQGQAIGRAMG